MKTKLTIIAAVALAPLAALHAAVKPNNLFSDNAVLQQGIAVPVWGTASEGEKVTVTFAGQTAATVAKDGKWKVTLAALKANATPQTLTIAGENKVEIKNVLVGEVWVCSGQSNMAFGLDRAANADLAIQAANDPQLRLLTVPISTKDEPQSEVAVSWTECTSATAAKFSAVGYFFGRGLRQALNVPVGLIHSSVGGTPAEAWTDRQTLESNPELKILLEKHAKRVAEFNPAKLAAVNKKIKEANRKAAAQAKAEGKPKPKATKLSVHPSENRRHPCGLYNGMIAPLQPYAIQGVIWYQGEGNCGEARQYQTLFPAMIGNWRSAWNQGEFPFLFVQIAPHERLTPELREAQFLTWQQTPNTAMAVITDVGEATNIHPLQKDPVGARLALAARAIAYGEKIEYSGPRYEAVKMDGGKAVLSFTHLGGGLIAKDGALKGFTIAGADKNFVPANAEISGANIVVSSDKVAAPVAVRYGWANVPDVNLFNQNGLPATPFRTDIEDSQAKPATLPQ